MSPKWVPRTHLTRRHSEASRTPSPTSRPCPGFPRTPQAAPLRPAPCLQTRRPRVGLLAIPTHRTSCPTPPTCEATPINSRLRFPSHPLTSIRVNQALATPRRSRIPSSTPSSQRTPRPRRPNHLISSSLRTRLSPRSLPTPLYSRRLLRRQLSRSMRTPRCPNPPIPHNRLGPRSLHTPPHSRPPSRHLPNLSMRVPRRHHRTAAAPSGMISPGT